MGKNIFENDPKFQQIDPQKLQFLMNFANSHPAGNAKQMASAMMSAASTAKKDGMEFTPDETTLLIELLKQNMSPAEQKKTDQIVALMQSMQNKKRS